MRVRTRLSVGAMLLGVALSGCRAGNVTPLAGSPPVAPLPQRELSLRNDGVGWTPMGPRLSGGWSGKINAFAYDPRHRDVMYVGGGWGNTPRESPSQMGIYKTVDGGAHWKPIDDGLTNPDGTISSVVNGLWLDPANPSVLLASTEFGGTFRSTDAGASWHNVDRSESTRFALSGSTLYLATRRGVLASSDDGATWMDSLRLSSGATTVVTESGATYAGSAAGEVYRRIGDRWLRVGRPGNGAIHDIAVDPFDRDVVYSNVDDARIWNQWLYGSVDGGKSWKHIHCGCAVGAQAIAFSRAVPHRLYLGEDSGYFVYLTADGNPNPRIKPGTQPFGSDTRYIVPVRGTYSGDDACYILQDQGLAYAPRCSSGRAPRLSAVPNTLAYSFALTPDRRRMVVALQDNGAGESLNQGRSWRYIPHTGEGGETVVDPFKPQRCYFAHPDNGLYASFDGCAKFGKTAVSGIESLAFSPSRTNALYAVTGANRSDAHVSVSTDAGMTWKPAPWRFANPYQIVISPLDAKSMLVATGTAASRPRLYYSHDAGRTWHESGGLPKALLPQMLIYFPAHRLFAAFDPRDAARILVADHEPATDNVEIFRSSDGGVSFSHVSTLLQPPTQRPWPHIVLPNAESRPGSAPYYATRFYGNRIVFNPAAPPDVDPEVALTTRFGAYLSNDDGSTWRRIDAGAIAHHFIGVVWSEGYLYLASFGEGVIRSTRPFQ
ncbi:MAG: hypothetical protein JO104_11265 [Candidatus Eremiobacteraeota bacterium]|nr:hypothetical protein [Candidatus Eremiobacteraeota bacterium]